MSRIAGATAVLAMVGFAVASTAHTQIPLEPFHDRVQAVETVTGQAREQAQAAEKLALAQQILQAREQAGERGPFEASFKQHWTEQLTRLSVSQLLTIVAAGRDANLRQQIASMAGAALADGVSPDLGDSDADLVFTKVTPCRVTDTRVAGGALANASQRDFYIAGTTGFAAQGGVACDIPVGATSVAVNITVTGTSGFGWLRAWPYGSSGTASIINYAAGNTLANGLILPICDPAAATCTRDLTVRADAAGTHVIIDVMGYFLKVDKDNYRAKTVTGFNRDGRYLGEDCVTLVRIDMTVPGPGQIVIDGTVRFRLHHTAGLENSARFSVNTGPYTCVWSAYSDGWPRLEDVEPTGTYWRDERAGAVWQVDGPGDVSIYLTGSNYSGMNYKHSAVLRATFFPQ